MKTTFVLSKLQNKIAYLLYNYKKDHRIILIVKHYFSPYNEIFKLVKLKYDENYFIGTGLMVFCVYS